jgi:hypothetical protein
MPRRLRQAMPRPCCAAKSGEIWDPWPAPPGPHSVLVWMLPPAGPPTAAQHDIVVAIGAVHHPRPQQRR